MVQLYQESKVRAIGVSNYDIQNLKEVLVNFDIAPALNQVEFHPFLYQQNLLEFCEKNRIQMEAYSPLTRGERLTHPKLLKVAKKLWQNISSDFNTVKLTTRLDCNSQMHT
jgi:methylglyoxal/glyoxal reductase